MQSDFLFDCTKAFFNFRKNQLNLFKYRHFVSTSSIYMKNTWKEKSIIIVVKWFIRIHIHTFNVALENCLELTISVRRRVDIWWKPSNYYAIYISSHCMDGSLSQIVVKMYQIFTKNHFQITNSSTRSILLLNTYCWLYKRFF